MEQDYPSGTGILNDVHITARYTDSCLIRNVNEALLFFKGTMFQRNHKPRNYGVNGLTFK